MHDEKSSPSSEAVPGAPTPHNRMTPTTNPAERASPRSEPGPRLQVVADGEEFESPSQAASLPERPWATYALLAIIVAVFIAMTLVGHGDVNSVALRFGSKENDLIRAGEIWRFITPIFLHGSWLHLGMNGVFLYWFGSQIEALYGWRKYLILFFVAGIAGNVLSFLCSPAPSLGASGALFGLVGAGLVFPVRFRDLVPPRARAEILRQLSTVVIVNLAIGFTPGSNVDNMAHLGGLAGGAFAALFLLPDALALHPPDRRSRLLVSAALGALLLLVAWAGMAQWRVGTRVPPPPLVMFSPEGDNPWWSVGIPQTWRQFGDGGIWKGPSGAILQIQDAPEDTQIVAQEANDAIIKGAQHTQLSLDGKPAEQVLYRNNAETGPQVVDVYLVQAYGRAIALQLSASPRVYPLAQADFERTVQSLRILHAPHEETPAPNTPADSAG